MPPGPCDRSMQRHFGPIRHADAVIAQTNANGGPDGRQCAQTRAGGPTRSEVRVQASERLVELTTPGVAYSTRLAPRRDRADPLPHRRQLPEVRLDPGGPSVRAE